MVKTNDCLPCERSNCNGGVYRNKKGHRKCNLNFRCPGKKLPHCTFKIEEVSHIVFNSDSSNELMQCFSK